MRKQFDALTAQTRDLSMLAQKIAVDATEPMKAGISKSFKAN
jgi:hypothetical protein